MKGSTFFAQRLFDGFTFKDNVRIVVCHGKIEKIEPNQVASIEDVVLSGLAVPGYIDLQVNGGGGVLFNSTPTVEGLKKIMAAHAQFGTTAMLPTLITDTVDVMQKAAQAIAQAIIDGVSGIIGVHFEGPHLSVAKKGAHSAEFIRPISEQEWQILSRQDLGQIIVTLAPENVLPADIKKMKALGIKVCLGHTNADYNVAQKAVDAGADGFTHLFNAMSPLTSRSPGVVGCALVNDSASCGIILDGFHVDYISALSAIKAKPAGTVFLVTDAMSPVGTNMTEFDFFDRKITLNNGKLTSSTGELAGSVLDMATAVKNTHQKVKLPLIDSLNMASLHPANYIGQYGKRGQLREGSQADIAVLNEDFTVNQTWIAGQRVFG